MHRRRRPEQLDPTGSGVVLRFKLQLRAAASGVHRALLGRAEGRWQGQRAGNKSEALLRAFRDEEPAHDGRTTSNSDNLIAGDRPCDEAYGECEMPSGRFMFVFGGGVALARKSRGCRRSGGRNISWRTRCSRGSGRFELKHHRSHSGGVGGGGSLELAATSRGVLQK